MSRSSSSSFGSSLMRLNSLRTLGSRGMRVVDDSIHCLRAAAGELVDAGAIALHGVELAVERGRRVLGLGDGDGPAELADSPAAVHILQPPLELLDAGRRVLDGALLDDQSGNHMPRRL